MNPTKNQQEALKARLMARVEGSGSESFNLKNISSALDHVNDAIDKLELDPPKVSSALTELRAAKKSLTKAIDSYPEGTRRRYIRVVTPTPTPTPAPPAPAP